LPSLTLTSAAVEIKKSIFQEDFPMYAHLLVDEEDDEDGEVAGAENEGDDDDDE
jgi:hypothetical protein